VLTIDGECSGRDIMTRLSSTTLRTGEAYAVFADESGTHAKDRCYGIGALVVPTVKLDGFNRYFGQLKARHHVGQDAGWEPVSKSYGDMNLCLDLLKAVLRSSSASFSVIVVKKDLYRMWAENKEDAFWVTYQQLIVDRARMKPGEFKVTIDPRSDSYSKHDEVLEIIGNNILAKVPGGGRLQEVAEGESKVDFGIQAADFLTGAVVAAHNVFLNPSRPIHPGKILLAKRMAAVLGWSDLVCDTFPTEKKFNIWHFPQEWRAVPETRGVNANLDVPAIGRDELRSVIAESQEGCRRP
jgi:hypothetical protein